MAVLAGFTQAEAEVRGTTVTVPVSEEDVLPAIMRRFEDAGVSGGRAHLARVQPRRGVPVADRPSYRNRRARRERGMTTANTVMDSTVSDNTADLGALSPRVGLLGGLRHNPAELIDFSIQPVMFALLFTYVFGGAIGGSPHTYLMFALPGIIVQNSLFTTLNTATGLSTDLEKGFFDRLRSLPIARFAPLSGRILADIAKQAWAVAMLLAIGYILGFRVGTGPLGVLAAFGLVLISTLAVSWALVLVARLAANPEKVQIFGFVVLFPLTFTSDAFVRTASMPG
jgi:ABC-type multidrug transport system permease subunit